MRGKGYSTNIKAQMKAKNSNYRKYVAILLRTWKNKGKFNITKTSKIIGKSKNSVTKALQQSKFYMRHPQKAKRSINKNSFEKKMLIKNSEIRKRLAFYLMEWRKCFSLKVASESIGIHLSAYGKILMLSKRYRNQKKYNYKDCGFAMRWAKKILATRFLGGKCMECGYDNIFSLDFHHDSENKENNICRLMSGGFTWEDIKEEIGKCILLCRNCHQKKHIDTNRFLKLKLLIGQKIKQIETNKYKSITRKKRNLKKASNNANYLQDKNRMQLKKQNIDAKNKWLTTK